MMDMSGNRLKMTDTIKCLRALSQYAEPVSLSVGLEIQSNEISFRNICIKKIGVISKSDFIIYIKLFKELQQIKIWKKPCLYWFSPHIGFNKSQSSSLVQFSDNLFMAMATL